VSPADGFAFVERLVLPLVVAPARFRGGNGAAVRLWPRSSRFDSAAAEDVLVAEVTISGGWSSGGVPTAAPTGAAPASLIVCATPFAVALVRRRRVLAVAAALAPPPPLLPECMGWTFAGLTGSADATATGCGGGADIAEPACLVARSIGTGEALVKGAALPDPAGAAVVAGVVVAPMLPR
jgi:hypothetical protein